MRKVIKEASLALGLASFWFASTFFAAGVWLPTAWAFQRSMINAILGTLILYLVTRTEQGAKMFYEGPSNGGLADCWSVMEYPWVHLYPGNRLVGIAVSLAAFGVLEALITPAKDRQYRVGSDRPG